jgi:spore coat polysaccharide biosynthesis protein SpsF
MVMESMRIVAIIQARMDSTRLPGKVLREIGGRSMLEWVVERTSRGRVFNAVAVATTYDSSDNMVASLCEKRGYAYYRGSANDVLDRYYQTARRHRADVIVRITADCPLIDPALIDRSVYALVAGRSDDQIKLKHNHMTSVYYDFVANRLPPPWGRTLPIGLDTEVFTFVALERAWKEANRSYQREHVTPYFYEDLPPDSLKPTIHRPSYSKTHWHLVSSISRRGFRVALLNHYPDYGNMRWTVDTPEDLELVREIVAHFPDRLDFCWTDIVELFEREPELSKINAHVSHRDHLDTDNRGERCT